MPLLGAASILADALKRCKKSVWHVQMFSGFEGGQQSRGSAGEMGGDQELQGDYNSISPFVRLSRQQVRPLEVRELSRECGFQLIHWLSHCPQPLQSPGLNAHPAEPDRV